MAAERRRTATISSTSAKLCCWLVALIGTAAIPADGQDAKTPAAAGRIPLDEFRPRSQLRTPQHPLTRAKFPCINVHFHPEKLTPAELDQQVKVMDDANIAVSVSLDGRVGTKFSEHLAWLNERHPNRFVSFVRMDYIGDGDAKDPKTWDVHKPGFGARMADRLSEAARQGAAGLKLLKSLGLTLRDLDGKLISPDDPRFDPVWERAAELDIPVIWHCADPRAFFDPVDEHNERYEELSRHPDWSFHGGDFPKFDDLVAARMRVVAKHPKTTFILAHFADLPDDLKTLGSYLDQYPNAYVEFAGRIAELGRQPYTAREFFLRYQDRILFGTDGVPPMTELVPHFQMLETRDEYFPYEDNPFPPQGFWNIYGLDLPNDVLQQVYYENAARVIPAVRKALAAFAKGRTDLEKMFATVRGPARWEATMKRFDQENATDAPKPGGVAFVGSSSMVRWNLDKSFPGKGYVNRGFGGSQASEAVHFARRILEPLKPKVVVFYEGDNDIARGKSPEQVAADFREFVGFIHKELPDTRVVILSVKYSPSRAKSTFQHKAVNALIEAYCHEDPQCRYVDVATPLLGADGSPDPKYFVKDMLHLSDEGYAAWAKLVGPAIEEALADHARQAVANP
ncbi:Amidohydrolase [Caulifigura coniformis]|uniref:Amidohydrolase n=2 Tax=Caulifigura coniformis TaxID=2527983 RepID=A0A517S876_9PLAN|nr:Amidohydrolase [Caulifigura coniformis]